MEYVKYNTSKTPTYQEPLRYVKMNKNNNKNLKENQLQNIKTAEVFLLFVHLLDGDG